MNDKIDHSHKLFHLLNVTPETQPDLCESFGVETSEETICYFATLLDGTPEAYWMAVKLAEIYHEKTEIQLQFTMLSGRGRWMVWTQITPPENALSHCGAFTHAVHDALCEALGIEP